MLAHMEVVLLSWVSWRMASYLVTTHTRKATATMFNHLATFSSALQPLLLAAAAIATRMMAAVVPIVNLARSASVLTEHPSHYELFNVDVSHGINESHEHDVFTTDLSR
jgi:uroporphyrinogen-III decarboxylase